ncbi:MAG: hypothetical protein Q8936_09085 [Bacillota bacterium]|nr:hypothetical protein [Bacillota bacterium]
MSRHKHHRHHSHQEEEADNNMRSFSQNINFLNELLQNTDKEKLNSLLSSLNIDEDKFRNIIVSLNEMFNKNVDA